MSKVYSHPTREGESPRLLMDHLDGVYHLMISEIETASLYMDFENLLGVDKKTLGFLVKAVAYFHDLGKATPEFQNKIMKRRFDRDRSKHAALGAFAIGKYLTQNVPEEIQHLIPVIVSLLKRHHGQAENPGFGCDLDSDAELINWQLLNLNKGFLDELRQKIDVPPLNKDELGDLVYDWQEYYEDFFLDNAEDVRPYLLYMYLSSLLRWADETDAAFRNKPLPKRDDLPETLVEDYRKAKGFDLPGADPMNLLRSKFYNLATSNIEFEIGTLKGPTGIGKTLTLLSLALRLRNKLKREGYIPRIIYCLPFLSIIDQTYDVARKLFIETHRPDPTPNQLLQQHHLSEIDFCTDNEDENYEKYEADLLINSWNSELTITTFVSFFHSIFTRKRTPKFFRIPGSIVLLDEIQAIPTEYWDLTGKVMQLLAKYGGTRFIFSTATMPSCFGLSGESLVNEDIPLNRFELERIDEMTFEEFTGNLLPDTVEEAISSEKSLMIVMNTIASAEATFKEILELHDVEIEKLYYLSTKVPPKVRRQRIQSIKDEDGSCILVTTQLVEAGVDLDFDYCIRDMGPLDSIVQVAGRVNRSSKKDRGRIRLVELTDFNGRRAPSKIYDSVLLSATKRAMNNTQYNESELYSLVEDYFQAIEESGIKMKSKEILENIYKLEFANIADFKLIDESGRTYPVFLEIDDEAENAWREYTDILQRPTSTEDKFKLLAEKKSVVRRLAPYTINYRVKHDESEADLPPVVSGFCYVQKDELERYYDESTGFHLAGCDIY
ncbi:CRISPR-associated helicase Cas3' [Mesotoga prima]|uniref:CRISPR-associated helicase Cas3' n=1 Tax=Mesotoga prima TaxID=1184387 RepID=UPI002FDF26D2